MKAGIVYGDVSGIIRRYILDVEDEGHVAALMLHIGPGEKMLVVDQKQLPPSADALPGLDLIETLRGKPSENPRCVVIDHATGDIKSVVMACPVLDGQNHQDETLFQHAEAGVDWKLDEKGDYVPPKVEVRQATGAEIAETMRPKAAPR